MRTLSTQFGVSSEEVYTKAARFTSSLLLHHIFFISYTQIIKEQDARLNVTRQDFKYQG